MCLCVLIVSSETKMSKGTIYRTGQDVYSHICTASYNSVLVLWESRNCSVRKCLSERLHSSGAAAPSHG